MCHVPSCKAEQTLVVMRYVVCLVWLLDCLLRSRTGTSQGMHAGWLAFQLLACHCDPVLGCQKNKLALSFGLCFTCQLSRGNSWQNKFGTAQTKRPMWMAPSEVYHERGKLYEVLLGFHQMAVTICLAAEITCSVPFRQPLPEE